MESNAQQALSAAGATIDAQLAEGLGALEDVASERLDDVERRIAVVEAAADHDHDEDPSEPPPPGVHYGHREEPRPIDASDLYADLPALSPTGPAHDRNGGGATIPRSRLPYWWTQGEWNRRGLYNLTVENDTNRQVAIYAHKIAESMDLIDVAFRGFAGEGIEDRGHIGVVDRDRTRRMRAINVDVEDAGEHALEARGEVRGGHLRARKVAYAGNPTTGDVVEDLILEWLDTASDRPNEWHWGAMKSGGDVVGAAFNRVIFLRGAAWTDLGAVHSYEDCQFLDSPGWGLHHELDKWMQPTVPALRVSYSTFRGNCSDRSFGNHHWFNYPGTGRDRGGSGNPSHLQHAHITAHMGTVQADHCLIDLDVTTEVAWTEWTDGGKRNGQSPPSGVRQTSLGSRLEDSLIRVSHQEGQRVDGLIACWSNPAWNTWERVRIELPERLEDEQLFIVREGNTWRRLTAQRFIDDYAPTCELVAA